MPSRPRVDQRILDAASRIVAKRPRTVVEHILKHGFITTEELEASYGYNHPPRAARDVREAGLPLETFRVRDSTGRSIGAYRFGDPDKIEAFKLAGRRTFSKELKLTLVARDGLRCAICHTPYESRYLSIDHRTPYEVTGDSSDSDENAADFLLLCGSCQRSKSWSCEHCENWSREKNPDTCKTCYWADPVGHTHVATSSIRRLDLTWKGEETADYNSLVCEAKREGYSVPDHAKRVLKESGRTKKATRG